MLINKKSVFGAINLNFIIKHIIKTFFSLNSLLIREIKGLIWRYAFVVDLSAMVYLN